jgi:hypothetical protein
MEVDLSRVERQGWFTESPEFQIKRSVG